MIIAIPAYKIFERFAFIGKCNYGRQYVSRVMYIVVSQHAIKHLAFKKKGQEICKEHGEPGDREYAAIHGFKLIYSVTSRSLEAPPLLTHSSISAVLKRQSLPIFDAGILRCPIQRINTWRFTPR
jgi:hypothetical protein